MLPTRAVARWTSTEKGELLLMLEAFLLRLLLVFAPIYAVLDAVIDRESFSESLKRYCGMFLSGANESE